MALEDITDSIKAWLNDKLKNPYFASVIAVWLISNRVAVFGLFNFHENQSLQDRVSWVHEQLQHNKVYPFKIFGIERFPIEGFFPVIIYSFILGLLTMVAFRYLNVIGKGVYSVLGRGANSLNKKIKPEKWIEIEEVVKLQKQIAELEVSLEKNQKESREARLDKDASLISLSKLNDEKLALQNENTKLIENSRNYSKIIEENNKYKSKFPSYNVDDDNEADTFTSYDPKRNKRLEEIQNFIKSEYAKYFDDIVKSITNHKPLSSNVSDYVRDFYISNKLISLKDNLFIMTPLGEEYYQEYLKTKQYPTKKIPKQTIKLKAKVPFPITVPGGIDCSTEIRFRVADSAVGKSINFSFKDADGRELKLPVTFTDKETYLMYSGDLQNMYDTNFGFVELLSTENLTLEIWSAENDAHFI